MGWHHLETQDLQPEEDHVTVHELEGAAEAKVGAVDLIERREQAGPSCHRHAKVAARELRIVEANVAFASTDVDLIPIEGKRVAVAAVELDRHEARASREPFALRGSAGAES
jgi:hypothetical protein